MSTPITTDPTTADQQRRELGWAGRSPTDPDVVALREHLDANTGIRGLEILEPGEIERAVKLFMRDGFVVVGDVLTADQTATLRAGCDEVVDEIVALDDDRFGNRGSHRYSFGGSSITRSQLHRPEWQMLLDLPTLTPILAAIFGSGDYMLAPRAATSVSPEPSNTSRSTPTPATSTAAVPPPSTLSTTRVAT